MLWRIGPILYFLLLLRAKTAVCSVQCLVSPAGALHPVQGQLEEFGAGPGCAARESGDKETHIISIGRATQSPNKQVTVLLRPLYISRPPSRQLKLVLSSQQAVLWWLEGERLPPGLTVLVQVAPHSRVQSSSVAVQVQRVASLPWRPRPLLRWSLKHHSSVSSLTHAPHANQVYIRLGEDPTMPSECRLQPLFLSHNYLTSNLQPQGVRGCVPPGGREVVEVHIIRLLSAGSGICGSLQVEVSVSLEPPVANSGWYELVLILSSAVPVNWALTARGLQGHISVYSSNTVSPFYPPEPDLTLTSTLTSNLRTIHDLLGWAKQSGFPKVTSYTEADLANRFVIRLAGGGTDRVPSLRFRDGWLRGAPDWEQELRLRQWLSRGGDGTEGGREAISVQCLDGRLNVAVDVSILKSLSLAVWAVSLRDPRCQAQFNGSHFLLAFPVISCGTEGVLEEEPRGVQYKNIVLLWRDGSSGDAHNETEEAEQTDGRTPLIIHVSCLAPVPNPPGAPQVPSSADAARGTWAQQDAGPLDGPGNQTESILSLQLFVTESYEQRETGPCVITADNRVYVEVSVKAVLKAGLEVQSCTVSPLSDPQAVPGWSVIRDGCSVDPTFILSQEGLAGERKGEGGLRVLPAGPLNLRQKRRDKEGDVIAGSSARSGAEGETTGAIEREKLVSDGQEAEKSKDMRDGGGGEVRRLRFSFVLRPVYNNSIQFLHCSLRKCNAEPAPSELERVTALACPGGLRVPALLAGPISKKCKNRILSRPMLVTQPVQLARPLAPSAGQRAHRPSVLMQSKPSPADSSPVIETGPVVGIVFAAFLMGISLMGALWCIYSRTGMNQPIRRGSLLDTTEQTAASWNSPALMRQTNSSV